MVGQALVRGRQRLRHVDEPAPLRGQLTVADDLEGDVRVDEAREVALKCLAAATAEEVEELVRNEFKARWPELFPPHALPKVPESPQ